MLGRATFEPDEIERARRATTAHLTALRDALAALGPGPVHDELEHRATTVGLLALDRPFVHRVRAVSGKDANPCNEVELLVTAVTDHEGVLRANKVIRYRPEETVLGIAPDAPVRLSVDDLARLAEAFFTEIEKRFRSAG